ncbi:hypothetical protein GN958_ATG10522 [Phytophthora infestans]|uniref:Uncharacterized protein n=1 Tax=Phytophthora infestans TaxID=4787 RepID=A0A8S9UPZ4_PHYIN|nr:hypothetical protein GN958_ATG10522 [Phytophthora infestans]
MVLNNVPSPSLGGVAPIATMTGLPAMSPTDHLAFPGPTEMAIRESIQASKQDHVKNLRKVLDEMHRCTNQVNREVRAGARMSHNKKLGAAVAQFDIGDYVLYADVWQHTRSQLRVSWCRPAQVTGTVSNWIFVIENLITGQGREAHASRLKVYADSSLNVSDDVLKHAAHNS